MCVQILRTASAREDSEAPRKRARVGEIGPTLRIPTGRTEAGDLVLGFLAVVELVLVATEADEEDLAGAKRARQALKTLEAAEDIGVYCSRK